MGRRRSSLGRLREERVEWRVAREEDGLRSLIVARWMTDARPRVGW